MDGAVGESGQDRGQVFANRQADSAATLHDGQDCSYLGSGRLAADMDPVLSSIKIFR
jgi:hypothetical protein